ncbi:MAG: AsnC family transcriptional regulator, partial [Dehalococcoidia bacterium]|nr:AsnC family transcriptional regulator [Dehalococcoidia bacterium]
MSKQLVERRVQVDDLDRRLVSLLSKDGRQSNRALARQLGVSSVTVQNRLRRLEKSGVIAVSALVDPRRVGNALGVIIGMKVYPWNVEPVMTALCNQPPVARVSSVTGSFSVMASAYFDSIDSLARFRFEVLSRQPGIEESELFIMMTPPVESTTVLHKLDELDHRLINALRENGRETMAALSRKLGVSRLTVHRRINQLIREGRIVIRALVLDNSFSFVRHRAALALKVKHSHSPKLLERIMNLPEVVFATTVAAVSYTHLTLP